MLGLTMLDVLIGLCLIYFILSITCSAFAEALAGWQHWRAQYFEVMIHRLLTGQAPPATNVDPSAVEAFRTHPLLQAAADPKMAGANSPTDKWPCYLSGDSFATILLDLIASQKIASGQRRSFWALRDIILASDPSKPVAAAPTSKNQQPLVDLNLAENSSLQNTLQAFLETATARIPDGAVNADLARLACFRSQITKWYDETMERGSGSYKRKIQSPLFWAAVCLTIALNVDTITIAQRLSTNTDARSALVQQAVATTQPAPDDSIAAQTIEHQWDNVARANLPLGWSSQVWSKNDTVQSWVVFALSKLFGLTITVLAVSMGASFWFDVLGKLVNLRSAGLKPGKSSDGLAVQVESSDGSSSDILFSTPPIAPVVTLTPTSPLASDVSLPDNYWSQPMRLTDVARLNVQPPGYSDIKAAFMARACMLAYQDQSKIRQVVNSAWGIPMENVEVFQAGDEQAFGIATENSVVIAFRGTVLSILQTVVADAGICLVQSGFQGVAGKVHCGFLAAMVGLAPGIDQFLSKHRQTRTLYITGHSLGAAMATLLAARQKGAGNLGDWGGLYTFGSPRVGDAAFVQGMTTASGAPSYRFVDDQDLITRVAPRQMGYDHLDQVYYLNSDGQLDVQGAGWVRFLNTVIDAATNFKLAAQTSLVDHHIDLYVRKLDNLSNG